MADAPDNEYAIIDATIVRAHQLSAGGLKKRGLDQAIGRSRGGLTTKIRVIVDALGNPLRLMLTGGQLHDITQAEALLTLIEPGTLLADESYDADHFADSLTARAIKVVIPPKSNRKSETRLRLRALLRAQSRRTSLLYNQAFSGRRDARREDCAKLPGRITFGLRARLA